VATNVPPRAQPSRPGFSIRIECRDPTATGLSALVPTLITATMELPLDGAQAGFTQDGGGDQAVTFAAGRPGRATLALARDPVSAASTGAQIFTTAAALASALIADKDIARTVKVGDTAGVVLATVLAAGDALFSLFTGPGAARRGRPGRLLGTAGLRRDG
jgi:hypothetical protein